MGFALKLYAPVHMCTHRLKMWNDVVWNHACCVRGVAFSLVQCGEVPLKLGVEVWAGFQPSWNNMFSVMDEWICRGGTGVRRASTQSLTFTLEH